MTRVLKVLIVEDEPLSRAKLVRTLRSHANVKVVGVASSGKDALCLADQFEPQLVFLDIQLPDMSGLEVARRLKAKADPVFVFVTAFSEHAIEAFEMDAVHYLLKPFNPTRVEQALLRARSEILRRHIEAAVSDSMQDSADDVELGPVHAAANGADNVRIVIRTTDRVEMLLSSAEIDWIEAADNYVQIHVGSEVHLVRGTLSALEKQLAQAPFARVHRSTIVNLDRVVKMKTNRHGKVELYLADGSRRVASRPYGARIRALWTNRFGPASGSRNEASG